jgi:hypothetical protein
VIPSAITSSAISASPSSAVPSSSAPVASSTPSQVIDGIDVQPPADPAVEHPFTPFPTPTQQPFGGEHFHFCTIFPHPVFCSEWPGGSLWQIHVHEHAPFHACMSPQFRAAYPQFLEFC